MKPWAKPLGTYIIRRFSAVSSAPKLCAERGRTRAQIEDQIVKRTADAADELGLGPGGELVVHAAERPLPGAQRVVDLDEAGDELVRGEFLLAEGSREESAVVAPLFQVDQVGAGMGVSVKIMDFLVSAEQMEPVLERAEADELISLEVLLAEAMLDHLAVQLLHAGRQVVLELEVGQEPVEQVELDAVIAGIGTDLAGVGDLGRGDQPLDLVAHVANLVVLGVRADVDGLVVDGRPGGLGQGDEGAGDVATVDQADARENRRTGSGSRRRPWPSPAGC